MKKKQMGGALFVALGIFLSRIAGLVRERVFAHFFGNSDYGDAFKAALKIPNFLQNLFGEGVLSASFIPVYAKLIGQGKEEEAGELASIIGTILFLITSLLVGVGILATPYLIDAIAPGFEGEKRILTIQIVQILFPGTGILVISAWCLGILNSHKNFFLPYVAPVLMNIVMIAALIFFGSKQNQSELALTISYAFILGSAAQFLIQLPKTLVLAKKLRPQLKINSEAQTVVKNFFPVVISRGVVQVSAYIDNMLASLLPSGSVSALAYAQTIYLLPISLFGMSISVAELPTLSQAEGSADEVKTFLQNRLRLSLGRICYFVIPSAAAFLFLGEQIVGLLFQTGAFDSETTRYVWFVLAGSTVGLLASTQGRLLSSAYYSLKDTKTPLRFAFVRVFFTTALGYLFAFPLPILLNIDPKWGTVGLTVSAGIAGWIEFYLLRRGLHKKIGAIDLQIQNQIKLWTAAIIGSVLALTLVNLLSTIHFIPKAILALLVFGITYLVGTYALNISEAKLAAGKILNKLQKR